MLHNLSTLTGAVSLLLTAAVASAETMRGMAWAMDNRYAATLGNKYHIKWYHHWADGPVSQMPSKNEYVPMFWGPKSWSKWDKRKAEMKKKLPKHLMGFNECDVKSQCNLNPYAAADIWMKEIHHYGQQGVKLGSPAIVWDLNWMDTFLKEIHKRGGYVDFICIHWYGSWKDLAKFKTWVQAVHKKFKTDSHFHGDIWVTELGITTASHPSEWQVQNFMMQAYKFMDETGYVKRASWFGCFPESSPPDGYATGKNALYAISGPKLTSLGNWYGNQANPTRRSLQIRHAEIAKIVAREEEADHPDAVHCDQTCEDRQALIDAVLAEEEPETREVEEVEA